MGVNFYIKKYFDKPIKVPNQFNKDSPTIHIGRISWAGDYCWDCEITLCKDGENKTYQVSEDFWYLRCPKCGKENIDTEDTIIPVLVFRLPKRRGKDVESCYSFTWAQEPEEFKRIMTAYIYSKKYIALDGEGVPYTFRQFLQLLDYCPIQLTDRVGQYFT